LGLLNLLAIFDLAAKAHCRLIRIVAIAAGALAFFSQEGHANSAIHPAWSNQFRIRSHVLYPVFMVAEIRY
jgi:hypothetical protein